MSNELISPTYFDRDLSWLAFNERVLAEAKRVEVPLLEQIKFLSIYSSNLDEFYRVRMPVLLALEKLSNKDKSDVHLPSVVLQTANQTIQTQQAAFGKVLKQHILPKLQQHQVQFLYDQPIPKVLEAQLSAYFLNEICAFLEVIDLEKNKAFFPSNNDLYFLVTLSKGNESRIIVINIPSNHLPRFYTLQEDENTYILFLDDILRNNLQLLFKEEKITGCYSFKVTRTAEIDLKDEYRGDLAEQLDKQLQKRDFGLATRFLYQPGIPEGDLELLTKQLNLKKANKVEGGKYHNLKDLATFPYKNEKLSNIYWPKIDYPKLNPKQTLHEQILKGDLLINPPYHSYNSVLRFFNEAAVTAAVTEIYVTLYRVASDSMIANALTTAAKNGKKVFVVIELKARFDEANNIKWAKKMKAAGVNIIYSVTALKVHAKIALVKHSVNDRLIYTGLLATGNFNETTANFYTDHILMTANKKLLREMELLFIFLAKRVKPTNPDLIPFKYLLVAQFNLQKQFLALIDREIKNAQNGIKASITIKLNNLEEKTMINKLYEASQAGVIVNLIIRGICRLVPQAKGLSENITVRRIVDRYLEHGRVFVFENNGEEEIYLGSADWMNRNIYRRIEVCFPIFNQQIKNQIKQLLNVQLADNLKAVTIDKELKNVEIVSNVSKVQSQQEIYQLLKREAQNE